MKIIITGCAGFIGFHFSLFCLKHNYRVLGIDNINDYYDVSLKKARLDILLKNQDFEFNKIDISNIESLKSIKDQSDDVTIVNLAAQAGVRFSIDSPDSYTQSNLVGFANILELARRLEARLIYASTSSVYGLNENLPFSERNIADHPIQFYAATKRSNEIMAHSYSHLYGLETIGLRFFTVYGPWGRPDMALFKFTNNILKNKPIDVFNNGNHVRDFTYVDDIVNGIYLSLKYQFQVEAFSKKDPLPHASTAKFKIYNLGNDNPVSLMEYVNKIEHFIGKKADINFRPLQQGDVIETRSDITLAKEELGYNPSHTIDYGIREFINWYREYYDQ